jgi:hypothetical protein
MARISHMPLPKAFLDYLDEKGIMTFEEVSLWGKDVLVDPNHPLPKLWLNKLIRQEYNHPSIIGWSVGNEIGSFANNPMADQYIKGAIAKAKEMDPNRLAMYVSNTAQAQAKDPAGYGDLIMLNSYGNWDQAAEKAHKHFPDKPVFFAEYGQDLNHEDLNKSRIDFAKMLGKIRNKPYVIGGSLWTFNDYRSTYWSPIPAWVTPPSQNRTWGVVNTIFEPKKTYYQIRREYLPLMLSFSSLNVTEKEVSGNIAVTSRGWTDFPAYHLKGFKIAVQLMDAANGIIKSTELKLPDMEPGTALKPLSYKLAANSEVKAVQIKVLDNQLFSRFDTLIHLAVPQNPEVLAVHTSKNAVRVVYNKLSSATTYSLKYGQDKLDKETPHTINNFIEVNDLKGLAPFKFELVAHNNSGSSSSKPAEFKLSEKELPPVIWGVVPVTKGFVISYGSDPLDYKYEVEYGTKSGEYHTLLTLDSRGVLRIPGLESNVTYYFRLRRIMQWGFASDWTPEMKVTAK